MLKANTGEGQPSGTTATNLNTGGSSGDAYDTVTGTVKFDNTHPAHGSNGYLFGSTAAATNSLNWTSLGGVSQVGWRVYVYATAFTVGILICRGRDGSANQLFRVVTDTSGKLSLRVNTGNTLIGSMGTAMSTGTLYRVEGLIPNGTSATVVVNLYTGDSRSILDQITSNTANVGAGTFTEHNWGIFTSTASVPNFWLDDMAVTDAGLPGPSLVTFTDTGMVLRALITHDQVAGGVSVTDVAKILRGLAVVDTVHAGVSVTDLGRPVRGLAPVDRVSAGASLTDLARTARALATRDQVAAGAALADLAQLVRGVAPTDAVAAGASLTDLATAGRALATLDAFLAGANLTDQPGLLRVLATVDQVTAGAVLTDLAATVRALAPRDTIAAGAALTDHAAVSRALSTHDTVTVTGGGPRPTRTAVLDATVTDTALAASNSGSRLTAHM